MEPMLMGGNVHVPLLNIKRLCLQTLIQTKTQIFGIDYWRWWSLYQLKWQHKRHLLKTKMFIFNHQIWSEKRKQHFEWSFHKSLPLIQGCTAAPTGLQPAGPSSRLSTSKMSRSVYSWQQLSPFSSAGLKIEPTYLVQWDRRTHKHTPITRSTR